MLKTIQNELDQILNSDSKTLKDILFEVCTLLQRKVSHYDWVGFYFAQPETRTLHLGPFAGEPTDHKVIPFGKGICGQVAESNDTFLVEDVHAQDNYIACSLNVKSEIVVPLFLDGANIGQIDIDSNTLNAFNEEDDNFLKELNQKVSVRLKQNHTDLMSLWV